MSGEYVSLKEPTQIVQKWRLGHWPQGHFSNLTLNFDQDNVNSVTVMRVEWSGVPIGEEDSTRGKWEEYYVRSLKTTFGFVLPPQMYLASHRILTMAKQVWHDSLRWWWLGVALMMMVWLVRTVYDRFTA